jgi:hypothetical protein
MDLQLQAHKVERDAHKMKSRAEKTTRISISPGDNCADVLQELVRPSTGKYLPEKFEIVSRLYSAITREGLSDVYFPER